MSAVDSPDTLTTMARNPHSTRAQGEAPEQEATNRGNRRRPSGPAHDLEVRTAAREAVMRYAPLLERLAR